VLLTLFSVYYAIKSYWQNAVLLTLHIVTDTVQCYWHYSVLLHYTKLLAIHSVTETTLTLHSVTDITVKYTKNKQTYKEFCCKIWQIFPTVLVITKRLDVHVGYCEWRKVRDSHVAWRRSERQRRRRKILNKWLNISEGVADNRTANYTKTIK
jgi:hypothetical protein